jgi:hypothetical protein
LRLRAVGPISHPAVMAIALALATAMLVLAVGSLIGFVVERNFHSEPPG